MAAQILRGFSIISIHTPREGCDRSASTPISTYGEFQSTHPARGATGYSISTTAMYIFQSTHPARGATRCARPEGGKRKFQSTHPARGATTAGYNSGTASCYFNPRTPRGVRRPECPIPGGSRRISIHAPREGCDAARAASMLAGAVISIHAPREGCDRVPTGLQQSDLHFNPRTPRGVRHFAAPILLWQFRFQSTHPARGATARSGATCVYPGDFNPRTPRGVRHRLSWTPSRQRVFQSTHPARGATVDDLQECLDSCDFNPRTPRGVRRWSFGSLITCPSEFQSTHPARGATWSGWRLACLSCDFNPRTPRGVRPW